MVDVLEAARPARRQPIGWVRRLLDALRRGPSRGYATRLA